MRRGDDNAIGKARGATAVIDNDRTGNDGGRRNAVILLNDGLDVVGGENLKRAVRWAAADKAWVSRPIWSGPSIWRLDR